MALNTDFKVKNSLYVSNSGFFAGTDVSIDTGGKILSGGRDLADLFKCNSAALTQGNCITSFSYDGTTAATVAIDSTASGNWDTSYTWVNTNGSSVYDTVTSPAQGVLTLTDVGNSPDTVVLGLQAGDSPTFAGLTLNGEIDMTADKIVNVADPTAAQDAATKAYVDSVGSGLVDSVTAGNGTITVNNTDAANPTVRIADTCVATLSTAFCTVANDTNQGNIGLTRLNGGSATLDIGLCTGDDVTFNKVDGTAGVCGNNIQIGVTGANEIDTSSGNIIIDSAGGATFLNSAIIKILNVGTGTDNTVLLKDASNNIKTAEIDSRVWGSTLVDNGGTNLTSGKLPVASDADTIGDSIVSQATVGSNSTLTIGGSAIIQGDLTVTGDFTCLETLVQITSAVCIVNAGTGPALYAEQTGANQPIATFVDTEGGQVIIGDGGNVGIGTIGNVPGEKLTVSGNLSASGNLYIDGSIINAPNLASGTQAGDQVLVRNTNKCIVLDSVDPKIFTSTTIVDGAGTCNRVPKYTATGDTIGDSNITDTGTLITLGGGGVTLGNAATLTLPSTGGTQSAAEKVFTASVGTGGTTVTTFAKSGFDAGKYIVTLVKGVNKTVFEVLVTYNGTGSFGTVYGIVDAQAASQLTSIDVTNSGSTIDLVITSASATTTAIVHGKAFY